MDVLQYNSNEIPKIIFRKNYDFLVMATNIGYFENRIFVYRPNMRMLFTGNIRIRIFWEKDEHISVIDPNWRNGWRTTRESGLNDKKQIEALMNVPNMSSVAIKNWLCSDEFVPNEFKFLILQNEASFFLRIERATEQKLVMIILINKLEPRASLEARFSAWTSKLFKWFNRLTK